MSKIIGRTADGKVVVDRCNSHLHSDVEAIIFDVLTMINTNGIEFVEVEIDLGRIIGTTSCVQTTKDDIIVFAQRLNRKGLTRFVLDRQKEPTSKIMVVLKKTASFNEYVLITAFLGNKPEVEPWDTRATSASLEFWSKRALVWGDPVELNTVTAKSPWQ